MNILLLCVLLTTSDVSNRSVLIKDLDISFIFTSTIVALRSVTTSAYHKPSYRIKKMLMKHSENHCFVIDTGSPDSVIFKCYFYLFHFVFHSRWTRRRAPRNYRQFFTD